MKRMFAAVAAAAMMMAAPAMAGTPDVLFSNTLVVQVAGGADVSVLFNADHTYSMTLPDGTVVAGAWADRDGQICMTPQGGAEECYPDIGERAVGDSWTATGPQGDMTLTVVAGR